MNKETNMNVLSASMTVTFGEECPTQLTIVAIKPGNRVRYVSNSCVSANIDEVIDLDGLEKAQVSNIVVDLQGLIR